MPSPLGLVVISSRAPTTRDTSVDDRSETAFADVKLHVPGRALRSQKDQISCIASHSVVYSLLSATPFQLICLSSESHSHAFPYLQQSYRYHYVAVPPDNQDRCRCVIVPEPTSNSSYFQQPRPPKCPKNSRPQRSTPRRTHR